MMKNLPLFYYPTTCIYVDDDQRLLNYIPTAFENLFRPKLFSSPELCLNFLDTYKPHLPYIKFLKSNCNDEHFGILQHTPTDFDITMIAAMADDINRYDEVTTMIIDYQMPVMNGFSLAKQCQHLQANKILLTGTAHEGAVISGFNQNCIQRFVQKGDASMEEKLVLHLKELSLNYFQQISAPLLAHLEAENLTPLSDSIFIQFFHQYCQKNNIIEYYLIDKQGSFLCVNQLGEKTFLVMHRESSLDAWVDAYGTEVALSRDLLNEIKLRKKVPFFGLSKEAWNMDSKEWKNYFYSPEVLIGREKYFWFELEGSRFHESGTNN